MKITTTSKCVFGIECYICGQKRGRLTHSSEYGHVQLKVGTVPTYRPLLPPRHWKLGRLRRCKSGWGWNMYPTSKVVLDISNGVVKIHLMPLINTRYSTTPGSFLNWFVKMQSENDMLPELDSWERKAAGSTGSCGKSMASGGKISVQHPTFLNQACLALTISTLLSTISCLNSKVL